MRISWYAAVASVQLAVFAQGPFVGGTEGSMVRVESVMRADPPSSSLLGGFSATSRERRITNGPAFYTRILLDKKNHIYFGYELLVDPAEPGTFRVTVGQLGVTPLDLAAGTLPKGTSSADWAIRPLPSLPPPRTVRAGESFPIELFVADSGDRLRDEIRISSSSPAPFAAPSVPTVTGTPRDFTVADAELRITQPRITLNRKLQSAFGTGYRNAHGGLVWLYLPDRGRYVLSLTPRTNLGFKKAGDVRGGVASFSLGADTVQLECLSPVASGEAPYNLYVLHDEDWEPTSEGQKALPALGTVSASEIAQLKRN